MLRKGSVLLLVIALVSAIFGCVQDDSETLSFTERRDSAAPQDPQGQRTDEVDISGIQRQPHRLLVMPFYNVSGDENIELFIRGLPEVIKQLFEADRFIDAHTLDSSTYESILSAAGERVDESSVVSVAQMAGVRQEADLVLCGRIRIASRSVVIEPILLSSDGQTYVGEDLPRMEVHLSNFMQFVNPLTENIRDRLSELQR